MNTVSREKYFKEKYMKYKYKNDKTEELLEQNGAGLTSTLEQFKATANDFVKATCVDRGIEENKCIDEMGSRLAEPNVENPEKLFLIAPTIENNKIELTPVKFTGNNGKALCFLNSSSSKELLDTIIKTVSTEDDESKIINKKFSIRTMECVVNVKQRIGGKQNISRGHIDSFKITKSMIGKKVGLQFTIKYMTESVLGKSIRSAVSSVKTTAKIATGKAAGVAQIFRSGYDTVSENISDNAKDARSDLQKLIDAGVKLSEETVECDKIVLVKP